MSRTYFLALTAETALVRINVAEVALDSNSAEGAFLLALAATDTADLASLHRNSSLVAVDTRALHSPTLRSFLAQLDNVTRAGLHTCTTGNALLFVDLSDACLRIDADGIKLTSLHTVATA